MIRLVANSAIRDGTMRPDPGEAELAPALGRCNGAMGVVLMLAELIKKQWSVEAGTLKINEPTRPSGALDTIQVPLFDPEQVVDAGSSMMALIEITVGREAANRDGRNAGRPTFAEGATIALVILERRLAGGRRSAGRAGARAAAAREP